MHFKRKSSALILVMIFMTASQLILEDFTRHSTATER